MASGGKVVLLNSLAEGLSPQQRVEQRYANEIGLDVLTLPVPSPLASTPVNPGFCANAFTVTLDTTKPWDSVRPQEARFAAHPQPVLRPAQKASTWRWSKAPVHAVA